MIQDSDAFRGNYRMGVVKEAYPSNDGKVRSVRVGYKHNNPGAEYTGTKFTYVDRPVRKLIVIIPVDKPLPTNGRRSPSGAGRECFADILITSILSLDNANRHKSSPQHNNIHMNWYYNNTYLNLSWKFRM